MVALEHRSVEVQWIFAFCCGKSPSMPPASMTSLQVHYPCHESYEVSSTCILMLSEFVPLLLLNHLHPQLTQRLGSVRIELVLGGFDDDFE